MKALIFTMILSLGLPAMADHHMEKHGDKWKAKRDKRVERMGAKAKMLMTHVDCLKAATTRDEYSKCRTAMKTARKEFRAKHPEPAPMAKDVPPKGK
ncbi:MAG: hypothetical protein MJK18_09365 [Bdellovibrionales bacterium]|nr:hypothetical protein [Bdellovibrionales bacterium]